jgi:hypothetical protein
MKLDLFLKNRFRIYLLMHILVVLIVTLCFRFVDDKKVASVIAGLIFLVAPFYVIGREVLAGQAWKRPSFWGAVIFLLSALPIFFLRIFHWQESFENLSLFGFSGPQWHRFSNTTFLVMLLGYFADSLIVEVKKRRKKP